jgi:adenine-specific DNA-methyltransferase
VTLTSFRNFKAEEAKAELQKLIDQFDNHNTSYKKSDYNESQLRIDFLNKFFIILGWDVSNEKGVAPSLREVITEDSIEIEGHKKAPDYSFQSKGKRVFFC